MLQFFGIENKLRKRLQNFLMLVYNVGVNEVRLLQFLGYFITEN